MNGDDIPQWLIETGRSPKQVEFGLKVPAFSGNFRIEKEVDADRSAALDRDLQSVIDESAPEQEHELHCLILDYMTANRISSFHAYRLLSRLWIKNGNGAPGLSVVDIDGNLTPISTVVE